MKETRLVKDMTLVHESEEGTKVYAVKTLNKSNLLTVIKVVAIDKEFNSSEFITFMDFEDGSFIENRLKPLSFMKGLNESDKNKIGTEIVARSKDFKTITIKGKINIREVFKVLYDELNNKTFEENYYRVLDGDDYIISTDYFNEIIEGCGWKSLEVKKILLQMDMLKPSTGRVYDYNVKVVDKTNNKTKNTWCLRIDKEALEEEANIKNINAKLDGGNQ